MPHIDINELANELRRTKLRLNAYGSERTISVVATDDCVHALSQLLREHARIEAVPDEPVKAAPHGYFEGGELSLIIYNGVIQVERFGRPTGVYFQSPEVSRLSNDLVEPVTDEGHLKKIMARFAQKTQSRNSK